ncbi:MAG: T9SS type A sorting domain-containing protein [Candidatus Eisenbacteria bacterium]|nr:T9SS type A sorting domain-containing protein [Candidatus Eisenbacteria bacterium]
MERTLQSTIVTSLIVLGLTLVSLAYALAAPVPGGDADGRQGIGAQSLPAGVTASPAPGTFSARLLAAPVAWPSGSLKGVGKVIRREDGSVSPGDILSLYVHEQDGYESFRVSLVSMKDLRTGKEIFFSKGIRVYVLIDNAPGGETALPNGLAGRAPFAWDELVEIRPGAAGTGAGESPAGAQAAHVPGSLRVRTNSAAGETLFDERFMNVVSSSDAVLAAIPRARVSAAPVAQNVTGYFVITASGNTVLDTLTAFDPAPVTYEANVAFVHHGNQGLGHSDVFHGRYGAEAESGFDETLEKHEATGIPGNFQLCPLLQTSQLWDHNCGDVMDFNTWLATGVTEGWAGIVSSAYGQHMMPFVQNSMNDWAVNIETQMGNTRYGYYPRVAWVPERVWLSSSSYPSAGVSDWIGDNWTNNGVYSVILDDDVHGIGYDNHQIHTMSGSSLKVILRDHDFTGKMHSGDGAGALAVLQNLASSGNGTYRIVTYADDWEMVAAMGEWAQTMPYAKGTYDWMMDKCVSESSWLHTWKLADALSNPSFNGSSAMSVTNGTYWGIGGTDGYGGSNNAWYTHWAGYIPYANGGDGYGNCAGTGGNCKNYGTLWDDAYDALMAAPNNNISQAGWYVLMTNLHETGWHDYVGGPISDWEKKYSSHMKNANTYAEASRWAAGLYANSTGAYLSDIDNDGYSELVMYNDRVLAVFESIGGRAVNIFAKGSDYSFSVVGVDNAYWYGTDADYNDGNHVGALSDVGPNYQHSLYSMEVNQASGDTVQATFQHEGVKKIVKLIAGQPYLDVIYYTGGTQAYVQTGFSPDLVDLVWNASMDRIWVSDIAYVGQRNPNTGATGAYVVGTGGTSHVRDFTGTIMKGDEITGRQAFELYLYAGKTSTPDGQGRVAELEVLADSLYDKVKPEVVTSTYFPGRDELSIEFTEDINYQQVTLTGISIDDDNDGAAEVTLDSSSHVTNTANGPAIVISVAAATAAQIEALNTSNLRLLLAVNTVCDVHGNGNLAVRNTDNKMISYGLPTMIAIDGHLSSDEWPACAMAVRDSNDSQWSSSNEIDALYVAMDSTYLYLALDGKVTANSWIVYLDTDPGGSNGQTDLTGIDHWERGALFTASGFKADWEYGCYQHQGQSDGDSFWKITSPTTSVAYSDSILSAFDSMHYYGDVGGSELAIPWSVLFGLGEGRVPEHCSISMVASLCWDPEPSGVLGGDSAPSNVSAVLPTIDRVFTFVVDADGDGRPDLPDGTPPTLASAQSLGDTLVSVVFSECVTAATAEEIGNYSAYETLVPGNQLPILDATLQGDGKTVVLKTGQQLPLSYTVQVSGVQDTSCYKNEIEANSSVEFDGETTSVPGEPRPTVDILHQNFPNPFNPATTVELSLAGSAHVRLRIFDSQGRVVRTLADANLGPGVWRFVWNGVSEDGRVCGSGVYFYSVESDRIRETRKMILLK